MIHSKQHIADLADICRQQGVQHVVISPGSRNAPLIETFYACFGESCVSIVDERSAGYFALGIARYTQTPVVIICTSGTAVLNVGPALAEALYQYVPLLAITADRPAEWIDQQDNQTIRQYQLFRNIVKECYQLPQTMHAKDSLWHAQRILNEAFHRCMNFPQGPIHINVPLEEPLYEPLPPHSGHVRSIELLQLSRDMQMPQKLVKQWRQAERIMIVHGHDNPQSGVTEPLQQLSDDGRVVIMAENIANVRGDYIIENPDLLFAHTSEAERSCPDLLLYSGGQVVSKRLKEYLRRCDGMRCWRIGQETHIIDTFQHTTTIVPHAAKDVYAALAGLNADSHASLYRQTWRDSYAKALDERNRILQNVPFCDLKAFQLIMQSMSKNSVVALGNSSVIRYSQFFRLNESIVCYANRGVSGIDGCLSTASGIAYASGKLTVAIVGDLSFVYDSNALWNRDLAAHLRIIVINNRGGGIFHLINGPSDARAFTRHIEAYHPVNFRKLSEAFGLNYFYAGTEQELLDTLPHFYSLQAKAAVLEIQTESGANKEMFHRMMGKTSQRPSS